MSRFKRDFSEDWRKAQDQSAEDKKKAQQLVAKKAEKDAAEDQFVQYTQADINATIQSMQNFIQQWQGFQVTVPDYMPAIKPPKETLTGAMRSWRAWRIDGETLTAITNFYKWVPGENKAVTDYAHRYWPQKRRAGFYGFRDPEEILHQEDVIYTAFLNGYAKTGLYSYLGYRYALGSTLNYGNTTIAEKGIRSEYAIPEYLILGDEKLTEYNVQLMKLAEKYKMQLITMQQAKEMQTGLIAWSKPEER